MGNLLSPRGVRDVMDADSDEYVGFPRKNLVDIKVLRPQFLNATDRRWSELPEARARRSTAGAED